MLTLIKKILKIIMLIFCILAFYYTNVQAVVNQTSDFYVNDYANVLSKETKEYIMNTNIELNNKTKAQIVVVTVKSLDGKSIEEYATEIFRKFGIGDSKKNNGVLLLCSTGDRKFRIEVGYGLEGRLTDGKTGRIQDDYIIPYLKNNNYDEGIKNGYSAVLEEVCKEYGVKVTGAKTPNSQNGGEKIGGVSYSVIIVMGAISFVVIFVLSLIEKKTAKIIKIMYVFLSPIIVYIIFKEFMLSLILLCLNIVNVVASIVNGGTGRGFLRRWPVVAFQEAGGGFSGGRRFFTEAGGSSRSF